MKPQAEGSRPWVLVVCLGLLSAPAWAGAKPAPAAENPPAAKAKEARTPDEIAFNEAFALLLRNDYAGAEKRFARLLRQFPQTRLKPKALFHLAFAQAEQDRYQDAMGNYAKVAKQYSESEWADDALFNRGQIYERKFHDYAQALEMYEQVAERYRGRNTALQARNRQSRINWSTQNVADAQGNIDDLNRMAQAQQLVNPMILEANRRILFIQRYSDYKQEPLKLYTQSEAQMEEKKPAEAVLTLQKLLRTYPKAKIALLARIRLAVALEQQGRDDLAVDQYNEALKVKRYPKALGNLRAQAAKRVRTLREKIAAAERLAEQASVDRRAKADAKGK